MHKSVWKSGWMTLAFLALIVAPVLAETETDKNALTHSVNELRNTLGQWDVTTEFLNPDGSIAKSVTGNYEFSWIVEDRVLTGRTEIPELEQSAGILFFVNESSKSIQMVSVGADGKLWVMTGDLGADIRTSNEYATANGGTGQLRFTRYNVTADRFESKMEWTQDQGETWVMGNHQVFERSSVD